MSYRTIEIEKGKPTAAALNPYTNKIYITYESSGLILIVNLNKDEIVAKISASRPGDVKIDFTTNKVYVPATYGIYEIDGLTNEFNLMNRMPETSTLRQGIHDSPSSLRDHLFAIDSITNLIYVSNYENESISIFNGSESNRLEDSIDFKESKWNILSSSTTKPSFLLINEDLRLLYVKVDATVAAGGGGGAYEALLALDLNTKKSKTSCSLPPTDTQLGFAFNRRNNTIYMRDFSGKSVLEYDGYLKKSQKKIIIESLPTSRWKRAFVSSSPHFAEVIVINPLANKLYVTDRKKRILYEVEENF